MATIMDLSFPGQWTTTGTSCIPHDGVYMPGPHAGKSENGVLSEQRATKKSTKTKVSPRMEEFPWLHYDEEKEKMFCTVCNKAKRKNILQVVGASTSNIPRSQSMAWTCLGIWNKTGFIIVILQKDSKICEAEVTLTPLVKFANPVIYINNNLPNCLSKSLPWVYANDISISITASSLPQLELVINTV